MLSTEFHWVLDRIVKPLYSSSGKGNRQREVGLIGSRAIHRSDHISDHGWDYGRFTDRNTDQITDWISVHILLRIKK